MASSTVALNDHVPVSNTFTLKGQTGTTADYIDTDTSLATPLGFVVKHNTAPVGSKANDRHQVVFSQVLTDTVTGLPVIGSLKLDISIPRSATWTDTHSRALNAYLVNYMTDARFQSILDGITP
jgi:hypothetical protein